MITSFERELLERRPVQCCLDLDICVSKCFIGHACGPKLLIGTTQRLSNTC